MSGTAPRLVLLHHLAPALHQLLGEWLGAAGLRALDAAGAAAAAEEPPAALLVGQGYPRRQGRDEIEALRRRWPRAPILLLSPTVQAGAQACHGSLARELGVEAVLPMPVAREALVTALRQVIARAMAGG